MSDGTIPEGAVLPPVLPKDTDYSVILSIAPGREQITFATHDRSDMVTMGWEALGSHRSRMTASEWRNINSMLSRYAGNYNPGTTVVQQMPNGLSPRLMASLRESAAKMAKSLPNPFDNEPPRSVRASAKEVMNSLKAMGASVDDALAIILAEITAADDPRQAASEWLTRFTSDVANIIQECDAEEEARGQRG